MHIACRHDRDSLSSSILAKACPPDNFIRRRTPWPGALVALNGEDRLWRMTACSHGDRLLPDF